MQVNDGQVRTSSKIDGVGSKVAPGELRNGIGVGMFRADDNMASSSMASISSAEVYFQRPTFIQELIVGTHKREEYGSLFNPYWQVRLKETPKDRRLFAWGLRAPGLSTSGSTTGLN